MIIPDDYYIILNEKKEAETAILYAEKNYKFVKGKIYE